MKFHLQKVITTPKPGMGIPSVLSLKSASKKRVNKMANGQAQNSDR
jgi:hypothetical protein